MLVCIPTKGDAGLEDKVFEHFGSAPFFTLYNSENGELKIVENRNAHHDHGTCHPMNQLMKYRINSVVCSGMGRRAIEALNSEGIKIYMADSKKVSDTVEQIKSGKLNEIDPAKACRGHGQKKAGKWKVFSRMVLTCQLEDQVTVRGVSVKMRKEVAATEINKNQSIFLLF